MDTTFALNRVSIFNFSKHDFMNKFFLDIARSEALGHLFAAGVNDLSEDEKREIVFHLNNSDGFEQPVRSKWLFRNYPYFLF